MKALGAVLVVVGLVLLAVGGLPYNKTENIAQIGDLKMKVTEKRQLAVPPVVSGIILLAGAALWFRGGRGPQT